MARFLTPLRVELAPNPRGWWQWWAHRTNWRLLAPLVYQTDVMPGLEIIVPMGDTIDFASVPRLPVVYTLTGNTAHRAAAVHDRLYRNGGQVGTVTFTRAQSDEVFWEAMAAPGPEGSLGDDEPDWRRTLMYWGVRVGGASSWRGL